MLLQVGIAGLSFTNQTFSPVTSMSQSFANDGNKGYPADGIAGMGFPSLSQMRAAPWFRSSPSPVYLLPCLGSDQ